MASHSLEYCQISPSDWLKMRVGCPQAVTRSAVGCPRQSLGLPVISGFFGVDAQPHSARVARRIGIVVFMFFSQVKRSSKEKGANPTHPERGTAKRLA